VAADDVELSPGVGFCAVKAEDRSRLTDLVISKGPEYWRERVKESREANHNYGVCVLTLLVAHIMLMCVGATELALGLGFVTWAAHGVFLVRAAVYLGSLLPFLRASKIIHYIATAILVLVGCGGVLWWLIFWWETRRAAAVIDDIILHLPTGDSVQSTQAPSALGVVDQPEVATTSTAPPRTDLDQPSYDSWVAKLDTYLASSGLPTRSQHFSPAALRYGAAQSMDPADFVRSAYDKLLPTE
jgi:hypothetical protein